MFPKQPPRPSYPERLKQTLQLLKHLPRTVGLVWASSGPQTLGLVALMMVQAFVPPAIAYVGKLIVDSVSLAAHSGAAQDREAVLQYVVLELGLMVLSTFLQRVFLLQKQLIGAQLGNHVNMLILKKALVLELRHFEDAEFYDKMQNARREASHRPLSMVLQVFSIFQTGITLSTFAVMLARLSWWSVLVIGFASLPAFIVEAKLSGDSFRLNSWRAPEARRQNYLEWLLTRDNHVKEVKLFGLGPLLLGRYEALDAELRALLATHPGGGADGGGEASTSPGAEPMSNTQGSICTISPCPADKWPSTAAALASVACMLARAARCLQPSSTPSKSVLTPTSKRPERTVRASRDEM